MKEIIIAFILLLCAIWGYRSLTGKPETPPVKTTEAAKSEHPVSAPPPEPPPIPTEFMKTDRQHPVLFTPAMKR